MYLLAPASPKEFINRALWFKSPEARKLQSQKKVEFGFEIKGPLKEITQAPDLFWGVHLPIELATNWYYDPSKRKSLIEEVKRVTKLRPNYAVLHGIALRWTPPAKDYIHRYFNLADTKNYQKVLQANVKLINILKNIAPLKIENGQVVDFYQQRPFSPYTCLHTGIQKFMDMIYLKKKTGVEIVLDIEHLILTLNFLNRTKNYRNIPIEKISDLTADDKKLKTIFGFILKKNYIPYLRKKISFEKVLPCFGAKYYHLTGTTQDAVFGKKILSHGPISPTNKTFRKHLKLVLAQRPEVLVLETASSGHGNAWNHLRSNETEISFENMCKILLEEL